MRYDSAMKTVITILLFFVAITMPDMALASDPLHTPAGDLIARTSQFIKNILLPLLISLAFLFFLINTAKYFIVEGGSEEGRKKAKRSAIYGIIAFVLLFSLWGIVGMLVSGIGLERAESLCPDYLLQNNGDCFK